MRKNIIGWLKKPIGTGIILVVFGFSIFWMDGKMNSKSDIVKIAETFSNTEPSVVIYQQLTCKLVEMLSEVRVIKEVAANLVSSYETQFGSKKPTPNTQINAGSGSNQVIKSISRHYGKSESKN